MNSPDSRSACFTDTGRQLALKRCLLRLEDWARTGSLSRLKALLLLAKAQLYSKQEQLTARALYLVTWHPAPNRRSFVEKTVTFAAKLGTTLNRSAKLRRSVLLKAPISKRERGLLLVSFEPELAKLAQLAKLSELEDQYAIVFLPTWQPFYSGALFEFAARAQRSYWIMPSSTPDQVLCTDFGPLCRPLPFQASSWISSGQYAQVPATKSIDFLMLANFNSYKRHWRLFEAAQNLPSSTRIVLAGRPFGGRTINSLIAEADAFGVRDRIQIYEDPSDEEVAALLASAKVFCALSHKEGSYIAVAEALMANTPVAMFSNAIVGSKEYLGPATGWLLAPDRPLGPQLLECLARADHMHPRDWARANIAAEISVPRFNELMRKDALQLGEAWTVDLAPFFCRHFEFSYLDPRIEADFQPAYQDIANQFGLEILRPPGAEQNVAGTRLSTTGSAPPAFQVGDTGEPS